MFVVRLAGFADPHLARYPGVDAGMAEIGRVLDLLIDRLRELRAGLDDGGSLEATFEEAARWRAALMKNRIS